MILDNFVQWLVVNALFLEDDPASEAKRMDSRKHENWTCIGSHDQFFSTKYGIEIRIWSVNQDNSQSWVRISYGTIKYVIDSNQSNTEILADPQEEQVPQTSTSVVAARSKAKAKTTTEGTR